MFHRFCWREEKEEVEVEEEEEEEDEVEKVDSNRVWRMWEERARAEGRARGTR